MTTTDGVGRFPPTSTRAELAGLFGVSVRTISTLIARGVVIPTAKRSEYETVSSLHNYLADLRKTASGRANDTEVSAERLRIVTVERKLAERKLAEAEGDSLTVDEVVEGWSSILQRVKRDLLAIPAQLRTQIPHFGAHEQEMAKALIRDVLTAMADEIELGATGTHVGDLREDEGTPKASKPPRKARRAA